MIAEPVILILDAPGPSCQSPADCDQAPGQPDAAGGVEAAIVGQVTWRGERLRPRVLDMQLSGAPPLADALARADVILTWRTDVTAEMIARAGRCLLIVHYGPGAGPGVARVALGAARAAGIYVASVPSYDPGAWAIETFRLIDRLGAGTGGGAPRPPLTRLGLVGLGCVGRQVAREGRRRGMEVWACDPFVLREPFATEDVRRADLENLFGICDIVSLHVPLVPATRGMIGRPLFALLKPGAVLVNTAAPELVDLAALADAMERGRPRAAAFDADLAPLIAQLDCATAARLTKWRTAPDQADALSPSGLLYGTRRAGASAASALACRRETARVVARVLAGDRPPHLRIDPPCPRHILALAGQGWPGAPAAEGGAAA